jgi:hypothetical protein
MADLQSCPFCGESGETEFIEDACWGVGCPDCDYQLMCGPVGIGWWPSEKEAIAVWNRRIYATAKGESRNG